MDHQVTTEGKSETLGSVEQEITKTNPRTQKKSKTDIASTQTSMRVIKRNGEEELVDLNKILTAVNRCCNGLHSVDAVRIATKTIAGLYHGATTVELDELSIQTASSLTAEEPEYSFLAARLLSNFINEETKFSNIRLKISQPRNS